MTVGVNNRIYQKAKPLGSRRYEINGYDIRNGQVFFYFDNLKYLEHYLTSNFKKIELGKVTEILMERPLDILVVFAKNKQ